MVGRSIEGVNLHRKELIALPGEAAILLLLLLAIASHFTKVCRMGFLHATVLFVVIWGDLLIFNLESRVVFLRHVEQVCLIFWGDLLSLMVRLPLTSIQN